MDESVRRRVTQGKAAELIRLLKFGWSYESFNEVGLIGEKMISGWDGQVWVGIVWIEFDEAAQ